MMRPRSVFAMPICVKRDTKISRQVISLDNVSSNVILRYGCRLASTLDPPGLSSSGRPRRPRSAWIRHHAGRCGSHQRKAKTKYWNAFWLDQAINGAKIDYRARKRRGEALLPADRVRPKSRQGRSVPPDGVGGSSE